jgi:DNA-binding transcriptional LysR family regulator
MQFRRLEYFVAVARERHFARCRGLLRVATGVVRVDREA